MRRSIRQIVLVNVLAAIGVPVLLATSAEIALRAVGYGHSYALLERCEVHGVRGWRPNQYFTWRFFPPALARTIEPFFVPCEKPRSALRIIVLGSSAAQGVPDPSYSIARMLEVLLNASSTNRSVEVTNLGITAINSHAVRLMLRECLALQPDALIVYMGNNEVVGPYGAGSVFGRRGQPYWRIRAELWLRGTRLGQLLGKLAGARRTPAGWRGMEAFMQQRVAVDDPALERVYGNLQANLADMCAAATRARVPLIVCTVGNNVRDCPPFLSAQGSAYDAQQQYDHGLRLLRIGSNEAARAAFTAARDYDLLRFRADSRINAIVRDCAAQRACTYVTLCDAEGALAAAARDGIPGAESFHEHVHFTFSGAYCVARAVARVLANIMTNLYLQHLPTHEDCADMLAYTAWDELRLARDVGTTYLAKPPFTAQQGHAARMAAHAARVTALARALTPAVLATAELMYVRTIARRTNDWQLYHNYANFLLQTRGDVGGALTQLLYAAACMPHALAVHDALGKLYVRLGRADEAWAAFARAKTLLPHSATLENNLGVARLQAGNYKDAQEHFQRALQYEADNAASYNNLAIVAVQTGQRSNAVVYLRTALQHDPHNVQTHFNLGILLAQEQRQAEARAHFEAVVQSEPQHVEALTHLGVLYLREGRVQEAINVLQRAVALQPQNQVAQRALDTARRLRRE